MTTKLMTRLFIIAIGFSFFACANNKPVETVKAPVNVSVDSLEKLWDDAWNERNLEALTGMLADNSIVFEDGWMVMGKDSLVENLLKPRFSKPKTMVLKTTKVVDGVTDDMVFRVGNYEFVTIDSAKLVAKGPFTIIWKKQSDSKWKIEVLQTGTIK